MNRRPIRTGRTEWRSARVGVVILVGLVLATYLTYKVGDLFDLWRSRYELVTYFPNVTGMAEDAFVSLAGYRVGKVAAIQLVPPEQRIGNNNVRVILHVDTRVREQIRADSRVRLRLQGLMGTRYLDIEPGTAGAAVLPPGSTVASVPAIQFEEDILEPMARTLDQTVLLAADLRHVTDRIASGEGTLGRLLLDDALYQQVTGATGEVVLLLKQINHADGTLNRLLHDPTLYEQLSGALERLNEIGRLATEGNGTLGRLLTDDEIYTRILGLSDNADQLLAELADFAAKLANRGGTLQRLLEDPMLYDQVLKTIVDIQSLIADVRENPKRFRPEVNIRLFP